MAYSNNLFEPDVLISGELASDRSGLPHPERTLMIAVLEDAARCLLRSYTDTERHHHALYEEARHWFRSSERTGLFDFENVCDVLGLDPGYLRRRVFANRDRLRTAARAPVAERV